MYGDDFMHRGDGFVYQTGDGRLNEFYSRYAVN